MNQTSLYAPPANVSLAQSLYLIFSHYCSPWKSTYANETAAQAAASNEPGPHQTMDSIAFARMCREAPDLDQYIGRTEIDLIFSKSKPIGVRRLNFEHFLESLLQLAIRIYPDEDPTIALANFLARFIFALFDQPPTDDGILVIDKILSELVLESQTPLPLGSSSFSPTHNVGTGARQSRSQQKRYQQQPQQPNFSLSPSNRGERGVHEGGYEASPLGMNSASYYSADNMLYEPENNM
jgi:hypothetical protein